MGVPPEFGDWPLYFLRLRNLSLNGRNFYLLRKTALSLCKLLYMKDMPIVHEGYAYSDAIQQYV